MKTLGEIIAGVGVAQNGAAPVSRAPGEPRLHRVILVVEIVAEIEVMASTPEEAFRLAERRAGEAKRRYRTAPLAVRSSVRKRVDLADESQGHKWVRLERKIDDVTRQVLWVEGRDDLT